MVHGFLLDRGTFSTVDFPGSVFTELSGINPQGDIVGNYVDASLFRVHVLLLRLGSFTTIDFPGAVNTFSASISPQGDIAGGYFNANSPPHGYVLSHGAFTKVDFPGSIATLAFGVNSEGVVVGIYADASLQVHGFLLSNGNFRTIDFPGAIASIFACGAPQGGGTVPLGINPQGDIVGAYCGADGNNHGFLLSNGSFRTIDFPGATFTFADGINPEGEIAGGYQRADGTYHGFLLSSSGAGIQVATSATAAQTNESQKVTLPDNVRKLLQRRLPFGRFGAALMRP
jgi:probable HAF family extracellular repeat protein